MIFQKKKISARRKQVRENISAQRYSRLSAFANSSLPVAIFLLVGFATACTILLSIDASYYNIAWKQSWIEVVSTAVFVVLVCTGAAFYIYHYQPRVIKNHIRSLALAGLFILLLALIKFGLVFTEQVFLATGTAIMCAIILTIAYNQRFAIGMSLFYAILACIAVRPSADIEIFLTMTAGIIACCFSLREIRTRMKLIEVGTFSAAVVFFMAAALGFMNKKTSTGQVFNNAGTAGAVTLAVGLVMQGLLPVIEKVFRISTSMTLLDYSDANQPLLKKLAMEAPGTYSHSLLIGSIAETAAESIGANGLLCRVGAYYHDIGKINKPHYFVENQMGTTSRHEQLSPAMSQLIIVGHVKDGIEMAKEYGLPSVLRQFIGTHHGTTLIEYFYNEAKKKQDDRQGPVSESEFRYPGPKPKTKEAAIVMLADAVESMVRSLAEVTPMRIEAAVHNMAVKRLQDGQFDECDLTLRQLSQIENSLAKSLAAHHHGRIAYPDAPEMLQKAQPDGTS